LNLLFVKLITELTQNQLHSKMNAEEVNLLSLSLFEFQVWTHLLKNESITNLKQNSYTKLLRSQIEVGREK